jgi:hypothetical protein
MWLSEFVFYFTALITFGDSVAGAVVRPDFGFVTPNRLYGRADDDDFNPEDLSYLKKIAAVGDSYSAGIGAGGRLGGLDGKFPLSMS